MNIYFCFRKEGESSSLNNKENPKTEQQDKKRRYESSTEERVKKSKESSGGNSKVETKKYKIKKDTKYTVKDGKVGNDNMNPKVTRSHEKVKKYKVVEDEPSQYIPSKTKSKKLKQKVAKEETVDEVYKSVKKTSQKKSSKEEDKIEKIIEEDLNMMNEEDSTSSKEGNNQKKKKYKLVELILEEDLEEDIEGNETVIEVGEEDEEFGNIQKTEREEIIEKVKTTHSLKPPKTKKTTKVFESFEDDTNEDLNMSNESLESRFQHVSSDVESLASKYNNPEVLETCKPLEDDPERQGPKKLTLYVIEEEIDGRIKKRVVSEEDGVSMCEVADLLKDHYYAGL